MNNIKFYTLFGIVFIATMIVLTASDSKDKKKKSISYEVVKTNIAGSGLNLNIEFEPGEHHNHPTMAVWIEDMNENYVQTLYVTKAIATGVFGHGEQKQNQWKHEPGAVRRPATLPYYLHKRNVQAPDGTYLPTVENPIPDAYSGATPVSGFKLETKTDNTLKGKYRLLFEVNQPWDWNKTWHNTLYPDNFNYKTSCQPALVYAVTFNFEKSGEYYLNPIGHSHFDGSTGELFTDLSSFTTALNIFNKVKVSIVK